MQVALMITCLTDTFYPRVGEAVVRVLRHFGCDVVFPESQTCCGQPAFNSGLHADAAAVARHTLRVFRPYATVVTPSASCAAMIKEHYRELLADDPPRCATPSNWAGVPMSS
jgi:L-lactate dehydrogenase complex protein LldE